MKNKFFNLLMIDKSQLKNCNEQQNSNVPQAEESKTSISMDFFDKPTIYISDTIQEGDEEIFEACIKSMEHSVDENDEPFNTPIKELTIEINSYGGSLSATLGIIAQIEEMQKRGVVVTSIVKGKAMSGACMIQLMANRRLARKFSQLMYHAPLLAPNTVDGYLSVADLRALLKTIEYDWNIMKQMLKDKTKLTDKQINKIYKDCIDFTMSVDEALEYGFIDEIL